MSGFWNRSARSTTQCSCTLYAETNVTVAVARGDLKSDKYALKSMVFILPEVFQCYVHCLTKGGLHVIVALLASSMVIE